MIRELKRGPMTLCKTTLSISTVSIIRLILTLSILLCYVMYLFIVLRVINLCIFMESVS